MFPDVPFNTLLEIAILAVIVYGLSDFIRAIIPASTLNIDGGRVLFILVPIMAIIVAYLAKSGLFGDMPATSDVAMLELATMIWGLAVSFDQSLRRMIGEQPIARMFESIARARLAGPDR